MLLSCVLELLSCERCSFRTEIIAGGGFVSHHGPCQSVGTAPVPERREASMITTHALSILVLALALAFVLICAGFVYLQSRHSADLAAVSKRLDALEAGCRSEGR